MNHTDLTHKIIGAAIEVHRQPRTGLLASGCKELSYQGTYYTRRFVREAETRSHGL